MNDELLATGAARSGSLRSASSLFGLAVVLGVGAPDDPARSTSRSARRPVYAALADDATERRRGRSRAARPDLRPRRAAARHERRRRTRSRSVPADLPFSQRDEVVQPAGGAARHRPVRHHHADRRQPRLALRSRPGRPGRRPRRSAGSSPRRHRAARASRSSSRRAASTPTGRSLSQLLGYTGADRRPTSSTDLQDERLPADDLIGKAGVEATYEAALRGTYGTSSVERDASGRDIQVLRTIEQPQAGDSLELTIDTTIQQRGRRRPSSGAMKAGRACKRGVVIVMNPQTGEILAMVCLPTYDNNLFARGHQRKDFQALLNEPGQAAAQPRDQRAVPARLDVQARHRHRRARRRQDHADDASRRAATCTLGPDKFYDWNHRGFGPLQHLLRLRALERHVLLPAGRRCSASTGSATGPTSTASARRPASTCRARSPGIVPTNEWKLDALRPADLPRRDLPGGHRPGLRRGHAAPAAQRLRGAGQRRHALPAADRPRRPRRPTATSSATFQPELIRKLDVDPRACSRRCASPRATVVTMRPHVQPASTCRSSSPASPARPSSASATARAACRSTPGSSASCRRTRTSADDPKAEGVRRTDSELAVLAFAYDSRRRATPRPRSSSTSCSSTTTSRRTTATSTSCERGNFYGEQLMDADERRQRRTGARQPTGRPRASSGSWRRVRPAAGDLRARCSACIGLVDGLQQQRRRRGLARRRLDVPARPDVVWPSRSSSSRVATAFDYHWLKTFALAALPRPASACSSLTLAIGSGVGGVVALGLDRRPLQFQFSELAKILMIVVLANYLGSRAGHSSTRCGRSSGACVLVGPPFVLVMLQPDLGTSLVFGAILVGMLFMSGASLRWLGVAARPRLVAALPVRLDVRPARLPEGSGCRRSSIPTRRHPGLRLPAATSRRSRSAPAGWFGKGLTNGTQNAARLPAGPGHATSCAPILARGARLPRRRWSCSCCSSRCSGGSWSAAGARRTRSGRLRGRRWRRCCCSSCS